MYRELYETISHIEYGVGVNFTYYKKLVLDIVQLEKLIQIELNLYNLLSIYSKKKYKLPYENYDVLMMEDDGGIDWLENNRTIHHLYLDHVCAIVKILMNEFDKLDRHPRIDYNKIFPPEFNTHKIELNDMEDVKQMKDIVMKDIQNIDDDSLGF
tara:strand:+ start:1337 stop:1801 length:465 start_codon:yes stop_codon:yes gene_type:complete